MGRIQTSIGLITGTNIQDTVDKLMAISAQPRDRLQNRIKGLQSQQTAVTELTALVIGVQLAANRYKDATIFNGIKLTSSNESAVSVTKSGTPAAGDTTLRVLQLAQTHRVSSDSFESATTALGKAGTIEIRSQGFVDQSKELKDLNGGQGVQSGQIRITDRNGDTALIDLTSARTVEDVLNKINEQSDARVRASVSGDRFVLNDYSGGSGTLRVLEVSGGHTAADLGFANIAASTNTVQGGDVLRLSNNTKLSSLRDGLGAAWKNSGNEFQVTFRDGTTLNVDFGDFSRAAAQSSGTTANGDTNAQLTFKSVATGGTYDGVEVNFIDDASVSKGSEQAELITTNGKQKLVFRIDSGNTTATDIANALANNSSLASKFTATVGGTGAGVVSTSDQATLKNGAAIAATSDPSLGDVLRVLNNAAPTRLSAKIAASGDSLELVDLTSGSGSFSVANSGTSTAASDLGLVTSSATNTLTGSSLGSGLRSVRLENLGRTGSTPLGTLNVTTRDGANTSIDLSSAKTLQDVVNLINNGSTKFSAEFNRSGTGLRIRDLSGGDSTQFTIASNDDTASRLGLATSTLDQSIEGAGLNLKFIGRGTLLSSLRQGRGISSGSFKITDSSGTTNAINLIQLNIKTVGELVDSINGLGLAVEAKINSAGDGIELVDTGNGSGTLNVQEVGNGTSATELRIIGSATRQTRDGQIKSVIDGSQVDRVQVLATDSLTDIATKINEKAKLATASVTTGLGGSALQFVSARGGASGRLAIDAAGLDLNLRNDQIGQNAVIQVGSDQVTAKYFQSADGVFDNVVSGISITAKTVTTQAVQIKAASDTDSLVTATSQLVDQYNKLVDKIDSLTFFDSTNQTTGILFGSNETLRIRQSFERLVTGRFSVTGKLKDLQSIGISINEKGKLALSASKLREKITSDPDSVTKLLSDSNNGLQTRIDALSERFAGIKNSALVSRSTAISLQIESSTARVDVMTSRLDVERDRLLNQFYAMEAAISKVQSNQNYISKITYIE